MATVALLAMSSVLSPAVAADRFFSASLTGFEETSATLSTAASGLFAAQLDGTETSFAFLLIYSGLEGVPSRGPTSIWADRRSLEAS